jgi:arylsulfatase A-like enzyme
MRRRTQEWVRRAVLLAAVATPGCDSTPPPPDLVIISVDALNPSVLRPWNPDAPAHPQLDALAAQSVRLLAAYAPASWTLPSHASLLTGLYPDRHGATHWSRGLRTDVPVLAEQLQKQGYQTIAFTDGGFVGHRYGLGRGFDRYNHWVTSKSEARKDLPRGGKRLEVPGSALFDRTLAWLREVPAPDAPPVFLFVHTFTVHDYFNRRPWAERALRGASRLSRAEGRYCLWGWRTCSPAEWQELEALYAAEVARLDVSMGLLLDALRARGRWDRTVLIVLSDHSEGFDPERHRIHHAGRVDADALHVPLLIRIPGVQPRDERALVSLVDVAPTLLDLAGAAPLPRADGLSLLPLLRDGPPPGERTLFATEQAYRWTANGRKDVPEAPARPLGVAAIRGDHIYQWGADGSEQLSPLRDGDPAPEATPEILEEWRRSVADRTKPSEAGPLVATDAELEEQLRSLGYAE